MPSKPAKRFWCPGRCYRCKRRVIIYRCHSARPMTSYYCKNCRIRLFRYVIPKGMRFRRIEYST